MASSKHDIKKYLTGDSYTWDSPQTTVVASLSDLRFLDDRLKSVAAGIESQYGGEKKIAMAFVTPPLSEDQQQANTKHQQRQPNSPHMAGAPNPYTRFENELAVEMTKGVIALLHFDGPSQTRVPIWEAHFEEFSVRKIKLHRKELADIYRKGKTRRDATPGGSVKALAVKTDTIEIFSGGMQWVMRAPAEKQLEKLAEKVLRSHKGNPRLFEGVKYPRTRRRIELYEGHPTVEFYLVEDSDSPGGLVSVSSDSTGSAISSSSGVFKQTGGLTGGAGFKQPAGVGGGGSIFK